jgi:hypothetical protein
VVLLPFDVVVLREVTDFAAGYSNSDAVPDLKFPVAQNPVAPTCAI